MAPSHRDARMRLVGLIVLGSLAFLTTTAGGAVAQAQQALFGQWTVQFVLTCVPSTGCHAIFPGIDPPIPLEPGGYSEPYRTILALNPTEDFEQVHQSLRVPSRVMYTFGRFHSLGQNVYRFVVNKPQQGEMPWTARMTLLSPSVMLYEDLSLGGKLQWQRVQ